MPSLVVHAPRPRRGLHKAGMLEWEVSGTDDSETACLNVAQQLSSPEIVIKPKELHLAFDWSVLCSRGYSRFRRLKLPPTRRRYAAGKTSDMSRSSTMCSVRSTTMSLSADVEVLVTRPIRRESTYIVWGATLAVSDPPAADVPLRNVLVKIAVDEEGGEDLREDARLHEHLVERGLAHGYYGIFVDSIGSTALVIDDFRGELADVRTPLSSAAY